MPEDMGGKIGIKHSFRRRKGDAEAVPLANAEVIFELFVSRASRGERAPSDC